MTQSSITGLIGHRQIGKTTISEGICGQYLTLDATENLRKANETPLEFLKSHALTGLAKRPLVPLVIDECQKAPPLFSELKEWVRTHKMPGQFLLTGSVKFTSRKAIQESLTGRILNLELLPMLVSENLQRPLPDHLERLLKKPVFDSNLANFFSSPLSSKEGQAAVSRYLETGGMPGICFLHDAVSRMKRHKDILRTILERDIRQVYETTLPDYKIAEAVRFLAETQGTPIRLTQMSRETAISVPTLQKLLYAFEAVFLIRPLAAEGDSRSIVYYFEDFAEARAATPLKLSGMTAYKHFIFLHMRGQAEYSGKLSVRFFQYSTRGGAIVPLCVQGEHCTLGIIPCEEVLPQRSEKASGASVLKHFSQSKVIYTHPKSQALFLNEREVVLPMHWLVV
ncbi:AAA family ATPase [Bdellovibrionota bacterium FG-1]